MKQTWKITFDHAAIACHDIQQLKKVLHLLGLNDHGSELVESQGVNTHFFQASPSTPMVEILEVTNPKGVVAQYLEKKGPGIHHLSFQVSDLESLERHLRANEIRLVYDQAQPGAHQTKVNFIHPKSSGGILIEISERSLK